MKPLAIWVAVVAVVLGGYAVVSNRIPANQDVP
jgi:hypothetical protein